MANHELRLYDKASINTANESREMTAKVLLVEQAERIKGQAVFSKETARLLLTRLEVIPEWAFPELVRSVDQWLSLTPEEALRRKAAKSLDAIRRDLQLLEQAENETHGKTADAVVIPTREDFKRWDEDNANRVGGRERSPDCAVRDLNALCDAIIERKSWDKPLEVKRPHNEIIEQQLVRLR